MLSHRELENFFFFFFQEKLKALIDFLIPFFFFSPKIKSTIKRSTSNWNDFVAFIASRATIRVLGESYPSFTAIWYMWYIPHRFKSPQRSRLHNDRVLKIAMSGNHGVIGEIKETIFHLGSLVPRTVLIYLIWKKEKKKEGKEKIYLSMNPTISPCHDVTNSKGYSVENTLVTVLYLQNIFSRTLFMHRISYT